MLRFGLAVSCVVLPRPSRALLVRTFSLKMASPAEMTSKTTASLRKQPFIDGKFHDAEAGTFDVTDPCTGEVSWRRLFA